MIDQNADFRMCRCTLSVDLFLYAVKKGVLYACHPFCSEFVALFRRLRKIHSSLDGTCMSFVLCPTIFALEVDMVAYSRPK